MRGKNADCTRTHSTKNKIQRGCYFYSGFNFFFPLPLPLLNNSITLASLHPVSHSITCLYIRSAVALLGLPAYAFSLFNIPRLSTTSKYDSILAKNITLDRSKAEFALHIDVDSLLYFLVG